MKIYMNSNKNCNFKTFFVPVLFYCALLCVLSVSFFGQPSMVTAQTPAEQDVIESAEEVGNIILDTTSKYVPQSVENKANKLFNRIEVFRIEKMKLVSQWKDTNYAALSLERENTDGNTIVYLIKHILLSILLFILSNPYVFYGLIILILFMILRRIWQVFFGSRYG